ncbi:MAG: ATP-binding protein [Spirochaetia bacterium]
MADREKPDGYIELKFGPRWKYISSARAFIQNFLAVSITDQSKADKIAMAASELLENAVKYASGEETHIYVEVYPDSESINVSVTNQATKEACEGLREVFDKISQGDPLQAYVNQMKEAAIRSDGKSQLGLVRIRYETGADIRLDIDEQYKVKITIKVG